MKNIAPDTLEPKDTWRRAGACAQLGPDGYDLHFPVGQSDRYTAQVTEAKAMCAPCPVAQKCAVWAITRREDHGIWGGLDERQRTRIRRVHGEKLGDPEYVAQVVMDTLYPDPGPLLDEILTQSSKVTSDGHARWVSAAATITFDDATFTPMQLAFTVGYGRRPDGCVRAACRVRGCVMPSHLTDDVMRRERDALAAAA